MSNEALYGIAKHYMYSETIRGVPIGAQTTLEQALADAEHSKQLVQRDFSRKGGKAPKSDALQDQILRRARRNPRITQEQLKEWLNSEVGEGVISTIDGESDVLAGDTRKIHFTDTDGREKTASLSGLKDRLCRAKKCIRAERLARRR